MNKIKTWILNKLIQLSNYAISDCKEGAESQSDINEVVAMKNYFIKSRDDLPEVKLKLTPEQRANFEKRFIEGMEDANKRMRDW